MTISCVSTVVTEDGIITRQHNALWPTPVAALNGSITLVTTLSGSHVVPPPVFRPESAYTTVVYCTGAFVNAGANARLFQSAAPAAGQPPAAVADEPNTACTPN